MTANEHSPKRWVRKIRYTDQFHNKVKSITHGYWDIESCEIVINRSRETIKRNKFYTEKIIYAPWRYVAWLWLRKSDVKY